MKKKWTDIQIDRPKPLLREDSYIKQQSDLEHWQQVAEDYDENGNNNPEYYYDDDYYEE